MKKEFTGNSLFDPVYWFKNVLISFLTTVIVLFIGAAVASYFAFSASVIDAMVIVITGLCIIMGGFRFALHFGRQGLLGGAISGGLYIVVLYVIGTLVLGKLAFNTSTLLMIVMAIGCGAVGGITGVNLKPKKRR